ncbi:MAG: ABC transporter ATP-binding protein [Saccharothrix sp.]|nr:ABC transporter ATP-binding protein [Saccharothrix sp.]
MSEPLLALRDVTVEFAGRPVVRDVTLSLAAGEVLAVVGESGSGKTVTAMSLLRLLPDNAVISGSAVLDGQDLYRMSAAELRAVRGGRVGVVFQEPMSALNPVFTIGDQLVEAVRAHRPWSRSRARARAVELLGLVGLSDPQRRLRAYPHELSGGQLQRVVIAMAVACEPALLIADEPTTALDVTVQAEIIDLLRDLRDRLDVAILLITHDMGVVASLADRVAVMKDGEVVEQGAVEPLFASPQHPYTRELLSAVISLDTTAAPAAPALSPPSDAALVVDDLTVVYGGRFGLPGVRAVDGVSLHVSPGEVLGLVGESGSGKSTIASVITGLRAPTSGTVTVAGQDLSRLSRRARRAAQGRVGVVFQDPTSSLNPRSTVGRTIAEPFLLHPRDVDVPARVAELLDLVHLPVAVRDRYPHELSGGQRQRVGIARALALDPALLIADEPTSALDVSVQARVLDLLRALQEELRFACLFISHDLAVVQRLADRVAVLKDGRVVEQGPAPTVLSHPRHPYTQRLLAAAPVADPVVQKARHATWQALTASG